MRVLIGIAKYTSLAAISVVASYIFAVWQFPEFFTTFAPNEELRNSMNPEPVPLSSVKEDELFIVKYRMKPVVITRASKERMLQLASLNSKTLNGKIIEEDSDNLFVLSLSSPHLGCILEELPSGPKSWPGGFLDTCHGLIFDYAGRALNAELQPEVTSRVDTYPDMKLIDFQIDEDTNEINFGNKAL